MIAWWYEICKTESFTKWIDGLSDIRARSRILVRIERLTPRNPGDVKPVGETMVLVIVSTIKRQEKKL